MVPVQRLAIDHVDTSVSSMAEVMPQIASCIFHRAAHTDMTSFVVATGDSNCTRTCTIEMNAYASGNLKQSSATVASDPGNYNLDRIQSEEALSLVNEWPLSSAAVSHSAPSKPAGTPSQLTPQMIPVKCELKSVSSFHNEQLFKASLVAAAQSTENLFNGHVQHRPLPSRLPHDWCLPGSTTSPAISDAVTLNDEDFVPRIDASLLVALSQSALISQTQTPSAAPNWPLNVASSAEFGSSPVAHSRVHAPAKFTELPRFEQLPPDALEHFRPPDESNASPESLSTVSASTVAQLQSKRSPSSSACVQVEEPQLLGAVSRWKERGELADPELLRLSVKELNRQLQQLGVPRDVAQYFKHRRRTLKNRVR